MKVAIYARYSSENQRDASIGDQFRICREFARRQGWTIAKEYSDAAVSGATLLRSGFQAMMASALRKEVDVALGKRDDADAREGQTLEESGGVFLVPAESIECFGEDNVESLVQRIPHQCLESGSQKGRARRSRDRRRGLQCHA